MTELIEHAIRELKLCGQYDEDPHYSKSIIAAVAAFTSYPHSGGSASVAKEQLMRLLDHENIAPLTNNPAEWEDVSDKSSQPWWQNKRNSKAMSHDGGLTYWLVGGSEVSIDGKVEREMFTSEIVEEHFGGDNLPWTDDVKEDGESDASHTN